MILAKFAVATFTVGILWTIVTGSIWHWLPLFGALAMGAAVSEAMRKGR